MELTVRFQVAETGWIQTTQSSLCNAETVKRSYASNVNLSFCLAKTVMNHIARPAWMKITTSCSLIVSLVRSYPALNAEIAQTANVAATKYATTAQFKCISTTTLAVNVAAMIMPTMDGGAFADKCFS